MSKEYDLYLKNHIETVNKGAKWMVDNIGMTALIDVLPNLEIKFNNHDLSKRSKEEYDAYDRYFYGCKRDGEADRKVLEAFNYAWLHHIHNNPHHWQYWVLLNDDKDEGNIVLEMPDRYIFEMICDWWSFSWKNGDLYEIFNWWNDHQDYIQLGIDTKEKVLKILRLLCDKINEIGCDVS